MAMAALYIPSWIFWVAIILFLIGTFSDSILGFLLVLAILAVFTVGMFAQFGGETLHNCFGWPTDHLIKADPLIKSENKQQEHFYEQEEEPEIEFR